MSRKYGWVEKLRPTDLVDEFDCEVPELNQFLQRFALINQKANGAQTYVVHHNRRVVGYYSLVVGSVSPEAAPVVVDESEYTMSRYG